jgi:hypothetical protein
MRISRRVNVSLVIVLGGFIWLLVSPVNFSSMLVINGYEINDGQGYAITGTIGNEMCGEYFSGVGDVSGDGIDDFIIGANANAAGRAYLFYGRSDSDWTNLTVADADASFIGETTGDWFGRWTAELGDVNGDGYADFAVSSMMNGEAGLRAGKAYLFFGSSSPAWTTNTPATQADVTITGEAGNDRLGHGIYGVGDTNGDGYDDIIISAFWNDDGGTDAGQLYLFLGRPQHQWLNTYSAADANASWVGTPADGLSLDASGVGDVNNDGFTDFAVGALYNDGGDVRRKVYLIFGSDQAHWTMDQPIAQSNASLVGAIDPFLSTITMSVDWISGVGDVNNDGFDDILFGAYEEDVVAAQSGQAYLFFGRSTASWTHDMAFSTANASFDGLTTNHYCGWCVDGVGDVNNDSHADIAISATTRMYYPSTSEDAGHVYLFLGNNSGSWGMHTSLSEATYVYTSEQNCAGFGFHVQGIGDVNNDSFDDFAIGAPDYDTSALNMGKAYVILPYAHGADDDNGGDGFPWALLILIAAVAVIVVLVVVIYLRRRKS